MIFNKELTTEINDNLFEMIRNEEILKHKAEHDALKGILNRRGFDRIIDLLKREQFPLAFAMIDIDDFKNVNDTYGHEIGDKILVKTAKVLKSTFRSSDMAFRLGGDEFALVLNNLTEEKKNYLVHAIERINGILKNPIDHLPAISISAGTVFSSNGYQDDIFKAADDALYEIKKNGKGGSKFANRRRG